MKRIISILLAALMMVLLCACGGGEKAPEADVNTGNAAPETDASEGGDSITDSITAGDAGAAEIETEAETEKVELVVGQTQSFEKFDITIVGFEYTDDFDTRVDGLWNYGASEGNVFLNVYYTVKYNAKEAVATTDLLPTQLNFDDGYLYSANAINRYFYYNPVSDEWHQASDRVDGMSPELTYVVGIDVPLAVMNEKDNALVLEFNIVGEEFTYTPRPASDEAKESTFTYGVNLLEAENWDDVKLARAILFELGDYNDSSMIARFKWFTYEDREFFKEYVKNLTPMTEDAVTALLVDNTFMMRNNYGSDNRGNHSITFHGDGSLDASYTSGGQEYTMYEAWEIVDGNVVLTHTFTNTYGDEVTSEYVLTPYQYSDNTYLLICSDGDYSMLLNAAE